MKPKIIAVVGPTASGKTSLGIEFAKLFNGEVISVDSRQVYRGMDIGTAKPVGVRKQDEIAKGGSIEQLFGSRDRFLVYGIEHWGIDLVDPDQDFSVAQFKEFAESKIDEILSRGHLPILVGGTGLWMKVVIENLDLTSTPANPTLRAELESRRVGDLYHEYKQLDPVGAELIDKQNKRRVLRALEVTKLSGRPFSQQQTAGEPKYDVLQIGLEDDREKLYDRINLRVDEMVAHGLVDEVRTLRDKYGCEIDAMTGIGYRQVCKFLNGEEKLADVIVEVKKATRHYAKRQMTWFKRDETIKWIDKSEEGTEFIQKFLAT